MTALTLDVARYTPDLPEAPWPESPLALSSAAAQAPYFDAIECVARSIDTELRVALTEPFPAPSGPPTNHQPFLHAVRYGLQMATPGGYETESEVLERVWQAGGGLVTAVAAHTWANWQADFRSSVPHLGAWAKWVRPMMALCDAAPSRFAADPDGKWAEAYGTHQLGTHALRMAVGVTDYLATLSREDLTAALEDPEGDFLWLVTQAGPRASLPEGLSDRTGLKPETLHGAFGGIASADRRRPLEIASALLARTL